MLSEEAIGSVFILRDTCEALILDLCRWLYSQSRFYHRHWDDRREFTRTTISNYALKRSGCLKADASWLCEFREQIKMRWHSSFFTRSDPQWWKSRIANRKWSYKALLEGRSEGKRAWVNLERENWINFISLELSALPALSTKSQVPKGLSLVQLRSVLRLLLVPPSTMLPIPQSSKRPFARQFELTASSILLQLLP
jgi:hypothetical protein